MSAEEWLTDDQRAGRDRLHDYLQSEATAIGPPPTEGREPAGMLLLDDWVLMGHWVDENGNGFLIRLSSRLLAEYRRDGLLHQGLYGWDG